ncbi:hypothetical protein NEUTE2DRAFT_160075 [Neurospora tetrasperma FGSC 2509]|nr:hypothetical protein NEUTE2DRAFT_160075 [Neurospora tetrasperma FGSC 2509]
MPSVPSLLNAVNIRDEIGAGLLLPTEGTMPFRVPTSVTILLPPSLSSFLVKSCCPLSSASQPASQPFQFYPDQASGNHYRQRRRIVASFWLANPIQCYPKGALHADDT